MWLFQTMHRTARLSQFGFLFDLVAVCIVIGIATAGLLLRARLPVGPLADGDTWGYLRPALNWLSGLGFEQTYGRDWLYAALLAGILKVSGAFCAITYVQRFLGLASILFYWLAWRSWLRLLPLQKPAWRWACLIVTLLLLALYALNADQALLENSIRPEGVLAFFELLCLYCLISFFLARWKWRRTGSTIAFGAATLGVVVCDPAIETELGFFARLYFAACGCRRLWQIDTHHAFRTIAGWRCCVRVPILSSENIGFPKGHAALSPLSARLYSLQADIGNDS